jgi:hypothetical protein
MVSAVLISSGIYQQWTKILTILILLYILHRDQLYQEGVSSMSTP